MGEFYALKFTLMKKFYVNVLCVCLMFLTSSSYAATQSSPVYILPNADKSIVHIPSENHNVDKLVLTPESQEKPEEPLLNNSIVQNANNVLSIEEKRELIEKIVVRYKVSHSVADHIVTAAVKEARLHNLDHLVILSVIAAESSFNPQAKNPSGALGLMQTIPRWHQDKIKKMGLSNNQLYGVEANVRLGTQILKEYLGLSNGNLMQALQRYNGSLKDRSLRYSKKIMRNYEWFDAE